MVMFILAVFIYTSKLYYYTAFMDCGQQEKKRRSVAKTSAARSPVTRLLP
jgi:hypothetical protein